MLLISSAALAHGDSASPPAWPLPWPFSLDAVVAIALAAFVYQRGIKSLRFKRDGSHRGREVAFYAGLACIGLALITPLDVIAEHLFAVHQVQHLLLRGLAPMLLMLAVPSGPLIAGLPTSLRRSVLVPLMSSRTVRAAFALLARPLVSTALYIGALYFWQIPEVHNQALLLSGWHYLMHVTMLASGLLFFWTVFDPRPAPWGATFPARLGMASAAIFANIPLGALITFKGTVTYAAYDKLGRWWGVTPLEDELLGGLVIWILASMMGLVAALLLVRLWGRTEEQQDQRRVRGFQTPVKRDMSAPGPGHAAQARRRLGWGLALVPAVAFIAVLVLAIWLNWQTKGDSLKQVRVKGATSTSFDKTNKS
ncbi:hypothetical protein LPB72_09985 [Hydrogenophaga crassostreae]|uniref:Cytochrome c oxidase assembly protein n=2 Tax=Hydrogenophaga crassostreae TaxID=1763535 RepID=A0A167HRP5_9BURK|nr:cytochrome c oxidase assembly protein [Hydrogenophaga crassostreae]AOW13362.1 hypothetical protein LPB072_11365 [Hydrogenophaga crassostreae]OAD41646.1 hypothetical protein LPB72_09985 [Hydrogenophaga crassostreae]